MAERRVASGSQEGTAAIRARHYLHDKPVIFADHIAIELLTPETAEACRLNGLQPSARRPAGIVIGRARYADDLLEAAANNGAEQYIMLGAGFESFPLRRTDLVARVRSFEIDHPASQEVKLERLRRTGRPLPASHEFIAADLEYETVGQALSRSSFRPGRRTFISWLGVQTYLTPEAVAKTLVSVRDNTAPGSEIVFDYRVSTEFLDPQDVARVEGGDRAAVQRGEAKHSFVNPHTFPAEVEALGYKLLENLPPEELGRRYFSGRSDGFWPSSHHWYAHFRRV